jgi:hypothetical protein
VKNDMENFISVEDKLRYLYGVVTATGGKIPQRVIDKVGKSVKDGDLVLYSPQTLAKGYFKVILLFIRLLVFEKKYDEATKLAKIFDVPIDISAKDSVRILASVAVEYIYSSWFKTDNNIITYGRSRSFQIDLASILIDSRNAIYDKVDNRKLIKYFLKESNENIELFKLAMHDYSGQSLLLDYIQRYLIADLYDTTMVIDTKFKDLDCFSIENYVFGYSLSDIFETFDTMLSDLKCVLPLFPTISDLAEAMDNYRIENDLERFMCNKYTISLCK